MSDEKVLAKRCAELAGLKARGVTNMEQARPLEYLIESERAKAEGELRAELTRRGVADQFDAYAKRLGCAFNATHLVVSFPVVDEARPPWLDGPLDSEPVSLNVKDALDALTDEARNPEALLKSLTSAKVRYKKAHPSKLADTYAKERDAKIRVLHDARIWTWSERPVVARAAIRMAEDPCFAANATLLRALAAAVEREPGMGKQLPPNDADRREEVKA